MTEAVTGGSDVGAERALCAYCGKPIRAQGPQWVHENGTVTCQAALNARALGAAPVPAEPQQEDEAPDFDVFVPLAPWQQRIAHALVESDGRVIVNMPPQQGASAATEAMREAAEAYGERLRRLGVPTPGSPSPEGAEAALPDLFERLSRGAADQSEAWGARGKDDTACHFAGQARAFTEAAEFARAALAAAEVREAALREALDDIRDDLDAMTRSDIMNQERAAALTRELRKIAAVHVELPRPNAGFCAACTTAWPCATAGIARAAEDAADTSTAALVSLRDSLAALPQFAGYAPDGSKHYQGGYKDGFEDAMIAARSLLVSQDTQTERRSDQ